MIKAKNLEVKLAPDQGRMELTFGECTLDVGEEPTKERRTESSAKAMPGMGLSLPVTRSEAPSALVPPEAASVDLKPAPKDDKSRGAISKPPGKKGASDSIPPGAS